MQNIVQVMKKAITPKQVVMFPFGGGSGYSYMELIKNIDADAEVLVINPPGRLLDGAKPLESIEAMVYLYSKELRPFLKADPLFFGHSIGGIVAYEICKSLRKECNITKMVISSVNPPHRVLEHVDMHSQMDREELIRKSTALGGMPHLFQSEPELLEMFISGLRADLKALESYHPENPEKAEKLNTNTVVLYGEGDSIVDPTVIREWELYLDGSEFIRFPGDHFYLFEERNRKAVTRIISRQINTLSKQGSME